MIKKVAYLAQLMIKSTCQQEPEIRKQLEIIRVHILHSILFQNSACVLTGLDYCLSSPCQNGGTCVNSAGSYTCTCSPVPYYGPTCASGTLLLAILIVLR